MSGFHFKPRTLTPLHTNLSGWAAVGNLCSQREGLEPPESYTPPDEFKYIYSQNPAPLKTGLTTFQKSIVQSLEYWSVRGENPRRFTEAFIKQTHRSFTPASKGLVYYSEGLGLNFSEQMQFFGLQWLLGIANDPIPEINVDEIDIFNERTHANPLRSLKKIALEVNPTERSRMKLILNRWVLPFRNLNPGFKFDISRSTDFIGADLSHLDLSSLKAIWTNFTNTNFNGARLHSAKLTGGSLKSSQLIGANLIRAVLDETLIEDSQFAYTQLNSAFFRGARIRDTIFSGCDLQRWEIAGAEFKDCAIIGIDGLHTRTAYNVRSGRHTISDSNLAPNENPIKTTTFIHTTFDNMEFEDSNFNYSHFDNSKFKNIKFIDCNFNYTTFKNMSTEGEIVFDNCDFSGVPIEKLIAWNRNGTVTFKECKGISTSDLKRLLDKGFVIQTRNKTYNPVTDIDF